MFKYGFIMAGGEGKRLRPLTSAIPKPLLPIGDKPIIELIIEQMKQAGIKNIFISVNYKKEIIKNFLRDGSKYGVSIMYIEEKVRTGTAGSLALLPEDFNEPLFVSNGDLICDINYENLFKALSSYDFIITGTEKIFQIDFGVLHLNGDGSLKSWEEKPKIKYVINGGMYAISPEVINIVRQELSGQQYLDMPSLWSLLKKKEMKIGVYVHEGKWHDVGRMEDYMALTDGA